MVASSGHGGLAPSPSRIHESFLSRGDLAAAAQQLFRPRAPNGQDDADPWPWRRLLEAHLAAAALPEYHLLQWRRVHSSTGLRARLQGTSLAWRFEGRQPEHPGKGAHN
ncbi:unnamed protein product [Urochloa humidicola]